MLSNRANRRRLMRVPSDDDEDISLTESYRATALRRGCYSDESLGTRSLPCLDRSPSPECDTNCKHVRTGASVEAVFKNVPFLDPCRQKFQHTLAIIKPEVARLMYKIETIFAKNGFIVIAKNVLRLSREQAAEFYGRHSAEPYFPRLVSHMASGPVVAYVLAKRDGVAEWRRLIGPADVSVARADFPSSLRAVYGTASAAGPVANAFHGSDCPETARREIRFFFPHSQPAHAESDEDDVERYIHEFMMPKIKIGFSEMLKNYPTDPLRWFGNWLVNNKNLQS